MGTGFPGHLVWPAQPCTDGPCGQEQGVCAHTSRAQVLPPSLSPHGSTSPSVCPRSPRATCHGVLLVMEDWEAQMSKAERTGPRRTSQSLQSSASWPSERTVSSISPKYLATGGTRPTGGSGRKPRFPVTEQGLAELRSYPELTQIRLFPPSYGSSLNLSFLCPMEKTMPRSHEQKYQV